MHGRKRGSEGILPGTPPASVLAARIRCPRSDAELLAQLVERDLGIGLRAARAVAVGLERQHVSSQKAAPDLRGAAVGDVAPLGCDVAFDRRDAAARIVNAPRRRVEAAVAGVPAHAGIAAAREPGIDRAVRLAVLGEPLAAAFEPRALVGDGRRVRARLAVPDEAELAEARRLLEVRNAELATLQGGVPAPAEPGATVAEGAPEAAAAAEPAQAEKPKKPKKKVVEAPQPSLADEIREMAKREDAAALDLDETQWHEYAVEWQPQGVVWRVDGREVFRTAVSPRPPLGVVIWVDNQYAAFPPGGRLKLGLLPSPQPAWLEVCDVRVEPGGET